MVELAAVDEGIGIGLTDCKRDLEDCINSFEDAYAAFNAFSTESATFEAGTGVSFDFAAIARFVKKKTSIISC